MIVAYVCDRPYIPYLMASMASVKRYNPDTEFVVLSDEALEIPGTVVHVIKPDYNRFKFNPNDRMNAGVYFKLYLPSLTYDKVLYLDCDMICQRPLNELWNTEVNYIAGTESHRYGKKQAMELGVDKYLLTSMMLMNLKALREDNFTEKCLSTLDKVTPKQHDETIINLTYNDKIKWLDVKYNYCASRHYDNPIHEEDAYLLHMIGPDNKKHILKYNDFASLSNLKPLLHNSSVAIVGNASSILKKNYGNEIDSHDIVIRFNKGFPSADVGYKTDLLFLACTLNEEELASYGNPITIRRSKLSLNNTDFMVDAIDRISLRNSPTLEILSRGKTHCQASTGMIAINFALSCHPKSIDIYGFDFFRTNTYYNPKGYITLHNPLKEANKISEYERCGLLKIH